MKKHFFTFLLTILIIAFNCTAQNKEAYNIKLKVEGLRDSTCYLAHFYLNTKSQIVKDTTVCTQKGIIQFAGNEALPHGIYIISIGKSRSIQLIIGNEKLIEMEADTSYSGDKIRVIKSEENKMFYSYQNYISEKTAIYKSLSEIKKAGNNPEVEAKIKALQNELTQFQDDFFAKNPNSITAKLLRAPQQPTIPPAPKLANGAIDSTFALRWIQIHYFDYLDLSDEMYIKTPYLESKLDYYFDNLNYQIPDSLNKAADFVVAKAKDNRSMQKYVISHIASRYERPSFMGGDAVFVHMAEKYFIGRPALWDSATLAPINEKKIAVKNVLIGTKIQNASLTDTTGTKIIALHDVKAKYLLTFFYDPECGHCKERTPKVLALYEKMKNKGLKVYAASTERDASKIRKFIKEQKTDEFINVFDSLTITDFKMKYNTFTTPQVLLLDKDKKIIGRGLDEEQMEDLINKMERVDIGNK
jgi:peroxiredoxin